MQTVRMDIYKDGNPTKYEDMPLKVPNLPVMPQNPLMGLLGDNQKK